MASLIHKKGLSFSATGLSFSPIVSVDGSSISQIVATLSAISMVTKGIRKVINFGMIYDISSIFLEIPIQILEATDDQMYTLDVLVTSNQKPTLMNV